MPGDLSEIDMPVVDLTSLVARALRVGGLSDVKEAAGTRAKEA